MAEQSAQDVVVQSQSGGDFSPSDAPATTTTIDLQLATEVNSVGELEQKENGVHQLSQVRLDDLEDASARSDTDTSRAEGSITEDKSIDNRPVKKFAAAKPVSFAKYSVPKVVAANAAIKASDKGVPIPNSSTSSLQQAGRPRLVAKTTSSLQQKAKAYKPVAPDPMQVWNKNRVTPTPSTKHLTDEELKQQYGIHLTSRLQADGEGKEAKWADIDDDEDDWAPETIEWNDGTKTTLTAEATPGTAQRQMVDPSREDAVPSPSDSSKMRPPQFTSSIGPNATVLKLGASAERQQAQKAAAEKARSPMEKPKPAFTDAKPAPTPAKSPWASLPPVDKVSPIEINPQPTSMPSRFANSFSYAQPPTMMQAPSPATEISADDFNRAWKESPSGQPRELFMPNSGRYEAVSEGRRKMSKNDQNFRAPAVLQRPTQSDVHAPAEPSAAFQTTRTSSDARRRASSTISGTSGQFARRLSMKSSDMAPPVFDSQSVELNARPTSRDGPPSQLQTPIYQARGPGDYMSAGGAGQADMDAQIKAQMREAAIRSRQKRQEEEAKAEAEKQERLRKKLAELDAKNAETEALASQGLSHAPEQGIIAPVEEDQDPIKPSGPLHATSQSPPKPPQPLATGEPQQYGMMKVHALDAAKKLGIAGQQPNVPQQPQSLPKTVDNVSKDIADESLRPVQPLPNGVRPGNQTQRPFGDSLAPPEPSPKLSKPNTTGTDARSNWGDLRDHRSPPSGNLWGVASNKALGNGTFDQSLAGYAPQDLSRTSSTAQGWTSGRTPTAGRSPQPHYADHQPPSDSADHFYNNVLSPEPTPLAADSEVDSLFPVVRPAPIGPPQHQAPTPRVNGLGTSMTGVAAWNNFHQVAGERERAENERYQLELEAKKAEELLTGVRQGPGYTFNETWKQVNVGDQANQRHLSNVHQSEIPASSGFGAIGAGPGAARLTGQQGRGSRFFPTQANGYPQERRAVTYSHPEVPRSPSPPPAEEYSSHHPAFEGDYHRPTVRFPRGKVVVKLPPAGTPSPPPSAEEQTSSDQPMTWAARVSMSAPPTQPQLRSVSTPIVQNPSWQERFNGLLGKKRANQAAPSPVAISSREPLDVTHHIVLASVSLPQQSLGDTVQIVESDVFLSKTVEEEEDLFEDRELASIPIVKLQPTNLIQLPLAPQPRIVPTPTNPESMRQFMTPHPDPRRFQKNDKIPFAIIRAPGSTKSTKKDLPIKVDANPAGVQKTRNMSGGHTKGFHRTTRGGKSRQASKAH